MGKGKKNEDRLESNGEREFGGLRRCKKREKEIERGGIMRQ